MRRKFMRERGMRGRVRGEGAVSRFGFCFFLGMYRDGIIIFFLNCV